MRFKKANQCSLEGYVGGNDFGDLES